MSDEKTYRTQAEIRRELNDKASRGPKKRDPACLQVQADIVIPKGTILRQEPGKQGKFTCPASFGNFTVEGVDAHQHTDIYRLVTAA